MTKESVNQVNDALKSAKAGRSYNKPETEYCAYRFYYDVKGLPFMWLDLNYHLKDGETCSDMARMGSMNGSDLTGLSERELWACTSEDSVIKLDISNIRMEGDVYKDTQTVITPDDILRKVKKYYEQQLITSTVTLEEVSLVYSGYFTDGSEGEIQPTVAPFWLVKAYDGGLSGSVVFVYDAFTGESIMEGVDGGW